MGFSTYPSLLTQLRENGVDSLVTVCHTYKDLDNPPKGPIWSKKYINGRQLAQFLGFVSGLPQASRKVAFLPGDSDLASKNAYFFSACGAVTY